MRNVEGEVEGLEMSTPSDTSLSPGSNSPISS